MVIADEECCCVLLELLCDKAEESFNIKKKVYW